MIKPFRYTWQMLDEDVKTFLTQMDFRNYTKILAVANGALPLLTKLANATKKPYDIVKCVSYENTQQLPDMRIFFTNLGGCAKNESVLIIDDVADTGNTLKAITNKLKSYGTNGDSCDIEYLTLCYKPKSTIIPHWYIHEIPDDTWIEFPWEM